MKRQRGMISLAGVLLLSLVAIVTALALRIGGDLRFSQQAALQGARAFYAAEAGLHWSLAHVDLDSACPNGGRSVLDLANNGYPGFAVTLDCSVSTHIDAGASVDVYYIRAEAEFGTPGQFDYVSRQLEVTYVK